MKYMLLIAACVVALAGCGWRIHPVPTTMEQISGKHYVRAVSHVPWSGEYKRKNITVIQYDGATRVLKDKGGNLVSFGSNLEMMNFFGDNGWRFLSVQRVEVVNNVHVNYILFERKD